MKILFSGWYGYKNIGDDAFAILTNWAARNKWDENDIGFLSPQKYADQSVQSLFLFKKMRYIKYIISAIYYAFKTKYFIYAGGSLFHSNKKKISLENILLIYKCLFNLKIAAIGVSIGPFKSDKDYNLWKNYLNKFEFITVRDKESYRIALDMKLKNAFLAFDLAALMPEYLGTQKHKILNGKKIIGVSLCSFSDNIILEKSIKIVEQLHLTTNCFFRFFIFYGGQKNGDKEITLGLINKLNLRENEDYEIVDYSNPIVFWKLISECSLMFCIRLHSGIFSAFANVPFFLVEYHRKCSDFLDDIGYPTFCRIGRIEQDIDIIIRLILNILENEASFILLHANDCIKKAKDNFILTKKYIN